MSLTVAAAVAMSVSFVACAFAAMSYVVPWLKTRPWPQAMTPLLTVHLFRHVALQLVSAQRFGFDISNAGRDESLTKQPNGAPHVDRSLISRQDIAKLVEQRSRRDPDVEADAVLRKIAADAPGRARERNTFPRWARLASPWHA